MLFAGRRGWSAILSSLFRNLHQQQILTIAMHDGVLFSKVKPQEIKADQSLIGRQSMGETGLVSIVKQPPHKFRVW